jgi:hypothetical protein
LFFFCNFYLFVDGTGVKIPYISSDIVSFSYWIIFIKVI